MIESAIVTVAVVVAFALPLVLTVGIFGFLARTLLGQETGTASGTTRRS